MSTKLDDVKRQIEKKETEINDLYSNFDRDESKWEIIFFNLNWSWSLSGEFNWEITIERLVALYDEG